MGMAKARLLWLVAFSRVSETFVADHADFLGRRSSSELVIWVQECQFTMAGSFSSTEVADTADILVGLAEVVVHGDLGWLG